MKKIAAAFLILVFSAGAVFAGAAVYLNGGVSVYNPTIGFNAEGQLGYASVLAGAGSMSYNNTGWGAGFKFYLFNIDGGPYAGLTYGSTGVKANTHKDSSGNTVIDSSEVFLGFSAIAGYRFFFADGWNINFGAGVSRADNSALVTMDITAGFMIFADDEAKKNAEKYAKSYQPEPEIDGAKTEMPGPEESGAIEVKPPQMPEAAQAEAETATAAPEPVTGAAAPAAVTVSPDATGNSR